MSTFTATHARALCASRTSAEETIFDTIRKQCDERIKEAARTSQGVCYTVPTYIFGLPIYNADNMYSHLYESLKARDFQVYSTPNRLELLITWKPLQSKKPQSSLQKLSMVSKGLKKNEKS